MSRLSTNWAGSGFAVAPNVVTNAVLESCAPSASLITSFSGLDLVGLASGRAHLCSWLSGAPRPERKVPTAPIGSPSLWSAGLLVGFHIQESLVTLAVIQAHFLVSAWAPIMELQTHQHMLRTSRQ